MKECPFCDSSHISLTEAYGRKNASVFAECLACGATGAPFPIGHDAEAMSAWDTRAERTCEMPMVFEDDEGNDLDSSAAYFRYYRCSNCGEIMEHYKHERWSYCPSCGAKIEGD